MKENDDLIERYRNLDIQFSVKAEELRCAVRDGLHKVDIGRFSMIDAEVDSLNSKLVSLRDKISMRLAEEYGDVWIEDFPGVVPNGGDWIVFRKKHLFYTINIIY